MRGCCRRKSNAANSLLADGEESQNGLFGFWIAVSFTVNYVMGSVSAPGVDASRLDQLTMYL